MVDIYYSAALKPTSAAYGVGIVITKITPLLPSTTSGARLPSIAPRPNMPLRQTDPFLPSYAPPPPIPARRRRTSSFAPGAAGLPFPPPLPLSNNPDLSSLRPLPPLPPLRSDLTVPPLPQGSSRSRRASMAHPNNYIPNLGAPNYASIGLGQPRPYPGGGGEFGASGSMTRPNPFIRAASVMPMQSRPRYISHMPLDTYAPESYKNFFELPKPPSKEPVLSPLRGPSKKKP